MAGSWDSVKPLGSMFLTRGGTNKAEHLEQCQKNGNLKNWFSQLAISGATPCQKNAKKFVLASQLPPKIGWGRSKHFYLCIQWAEIHVESNPSQDEECTNWVLVNDLRGFEDVRSSQQGCSECPKGLAKDGARFG
jgi:hypothetical protein